MKRIYPNKTRLTLYFIVVAIILAAVIFLMFKEQFLKPLNVFHFVLIPLFVILMFLFYLLTMKTTYYILENKYLSFFRLGKELRYYYKDVIFIDESKGDKTKTLGFYTTKNNVIYLTMDKENIVYKEFLKKCNNRLSKKEFQKKYPHVSV